MTDSEIEAAARELCRMRGVEPDSVPGVKHTEFGPVEWGYTNLRMAREEVRVFAEIGTAIASVLQPPKKPRKRKE